MYVIQILGGGAVIVRPVITMADYDQRIRYSNANARAWTLESQSRHKQERVPVLRLQ